MMRRSIALFALLVLNVPVAAQIPTARIDSIFARYDRADSPGCAVGVFRNGEMAYARGYGMANLELGIRIAPEHVFYVGSVSKQFTAMSIALLAKDGRLSLDDDVRKFIPELPEFGGRRLTIRHLVHHTSGLREKWDLMAMGGLRDGDVVTQQDVLQLVSRQQDLNFAPGDEHLYNNTAYDLLSTIVQRASSKAIGDFARERIFAPLGMTHTRYVSDRALVLPGRAHAYAARRGGGWSSANVSHVETTGSGGVYSTLGDLLKWDASFYSHALGGADVATLVQTPGVLNNGDTLQYAFGLTVDRYAGRRRVHHGGALGGYRAMLMRFPEERTSVAMLCNIASANTNALAEAVADVLWPRAVAVNGAAATTAALSLGEADLTRHAGMYLNLRTEAGLRIVRRGAGLAIDGGGELRAESADRFVAGEMQLQFERGSGDRSRRVLVRRPGTRDAVYDRMEDAAATPPLGDYAGLYRGSEADATWRIVARDGQLALYPDRAAEPIVLTAAFADAFAGNGWLLRFHRDAPGSIVDRVSVSTGRSRRVMFLRDRER
jgi:CubicO group peptidase (beta-lactamase class C family)